MNFRPGEPSRETLNDFFSIKSVENAVEDEVLLGEIREKIIRPFWEHIIPVVREDARVRAKYLGLDEKEVDHALSHVTSLWPTQILQLKEILPRLVEDLINEKEQANTPIGPRTQLLINSFNFETILAILEKRFSEEGLSQQEVEILDNLNILMENKATAHRSSLTQSITISAFRSVSLDSYRSTFTHEFTHDFLDRANFDLEERIDKAIEDDFKAGKETSINNQFREFLTALNESLAHVAQSYLERRSRDPNFKAYGSISGLFRELFVSMKDFKYLMTLEEFDKFSMDIYASALNFWHEDITVKDLDSVENMVSDKIDECKQKYINLKETK